MTIFEFIETFQYHFAFAFGSLAVIAVYEAFQ